MTDPTVSFQVRRRSMEGLDAVAAGVSAALGIRLAPASGEEFGAATMAATVLGLQIVLVGADEGEPGTEVRYVLRGLVRPDLLAGFDVERPTMDVSQYVLGVLRLVDDDGWYVADRAELLTEAGLPPDDGPPA